MARPCGCGSGGIIVACGTGLTCTGVGTTGDPLRISWQIPLGSSACNAVMDCVGTNLGSGLTYSSVAHRVSARISSDAGNMVGFGSDGGLLVTGSPDPSIGGVTLAGLRTSNLLGASHGAGYAIWPDGYGDSYKAAMGHEHLQLIHVPVRRAEDFLLYAVWDRNLGWYTNRDDAVVPVRPTSAVPAPWGYEMIAKPSGPNDGQGGVDNPYNVTKGYMGFAYPPQQGILRLDDVFQTAGRRKCLYLECRDQGGSADTITPAFTLFRLAGLIETWGLQKSIIVSAQLPTGDQDVAGLKQGLAYCKTKSIAIAAHITTTAEAAANPPASLTALGCTWVGLSYSLPDATIQSYVTTGLSVMMFTADRQAHWTKQQQLGVRGAFCSDPIYTAAHTYGFRYRLVNPPSDSPHIFTGQAANYGRFGYSGTLSGVHAKYRGWVDRIDDSPGVLKAGPEMVPPTNSGFHMPMGPYNPIYDRNLTDPPPAGNYGSPTNYDVEITVASVTKNWQTGGQQGMGMFFCVPTDARLLDLTASTTETIGYSLTLASNGNLVFRRYSGVAGAIPYAYTWASGWATSEFVNSRFFRIAVQVRPGTIRCGPLTENGGITGANSRLFAASTPTDPGSNQPQADVHRGPYLYLSFWEAAGYTGYRYFKDLRVVNFS
jgi:hypothetical protein